MAETGLVERISKNYKHYHDTEPCLCGGPTCGQCSVLTLLDALAAKEAECRKLRKDTVAEAMLDSVLIGNDAKSTRAIDPVEHRRDRAEQATNRIRALQEQVRGIWQEAEKIAQGLYNERGDVIAEAIRAKAALATATEGDSSSLAADGPSERAKMETGDE